MKPCPKATRCRCDGRWQARVTAPNGSVVVLAAFAGMRSGEIFELRRSNLDPSTGAIKVTRKIEKDAKPSAPGACPGCGRVIGRPKTAGANDGMVEKTVRIQEDHVQVLKRVDGSTRNIHLIDKNNIHNNRLQVINEYEVGVSTSSTNDGGGSTDEKGARHANRYDVTILVNGLPLVHVELKRRSQPLIKGSAGFREA